MILAALALAAPAGGGELVVIVHPERQVRLSRSELAQIYLKKRRFWDDGEAIVPVNRDSGSAARARFVRIVFGENARQLEVYWNRQYFGGVRPPATLASDEAVRRFVANERLAIGYVDGGVVDTSVRVVLRLDAPGSASAPAGP